MIKKAPPKKILLVDDDPDIRDTIQAAFESRGFDTILAQDGNQGLALAEVEEPDLVVLDMMMPKRSGFLVLERIRQKFGKPMPVIMITANEGTRHRAYAEMLGVHQSLRKPFPMDQLLDCVEEVLN